MIVTIPRSGVRVVATASCASARYTPRAAHVAVRVESERNAKVDADCGEAAPVDGAQRQRAESPALGRLERQAIVVDRDRQRLPIRRHVASRIRVERHVGGRPTNGARVCERDDLTLVGAGLLSLRERDRGDRQRGGDCDASGGLHKGLPVKQLENKTGVH